MSCEDRVIIVTGAGRGLGLSHARSLAHAGAKVIVNDLGADLNGANHSTSNAAEAAAQLRNEGLQVDASTHDVSDWEQAQELVAWAVERYGQLDGLIDNARISRDRMITNAKGRMG